MIKGRNKDRDVQTFRRACKLLQELTSLGYHIYAAGNVYLLDGPSHEGLGTARQDRIVDSVQIWNVSGGDW